LHLRQLLERLPINLSRTGLREAVFVAAETAVFCSTTDASISDRRLRQASEQQSRRTRACDSDLHRRIAKPPKQLLEGLHERLESR